MEVCVVFFGLKNNDGGEHRFLLSKDEKAAGVSRFHWFCL
jgi:hypothetical protein